MKNACLRMQLNSFGVIVCVFFASSIVFVRLNFYYFRFVCIFMWVMMEKYDSIVCSPVFNCTTLSTLRLLREYVKRIKYVLVHIQKKFVVIVCMCFHRRLYVKAQRIFKSLALSGYCCFICTRSIVPSTSVSRVHIWAYNNIVSSKVESAVYSLNVYTYACIVLRAKQNWTDDSVFVWQP